MHLLEDDPLKSFRKKDPVRIVTGESDYCEPPENEPQPDIIFKNYIDLVEFFFTMTQGLNFINRSEFVMCQFANYATPPMGLEDKSSHRGHTYLFARIRNTYSLHIIFESDPELPECRCGHATKMMHVPEGVAEKISQEIHRYFSANLPVHCYYNRSQNTYFGRVPVNFQGVDGHNRDFLNFEGDNFSYHPFFRTHKAKWRVALLGQNELLEDNYDDIGTVKSMFDLDMASNYKISVAVNASVEAGNGVPILSVVLPEENFQELTGFDRGYKTFRKSFQPTFSNFQAEKVPNNFVINQIRVMNDQEGNQGLCLRGISLNFYSGMDI